MNLANEIINGRTAVTSDEVKVLCERIAGLYHEQDNVMIMPSENVFFVGDLHGDLGAAKTVYDIFKRYPNHSIVFLGDYADRGPHQVETVNFVLALGLLHPNRVLLLRGNHESERVAVRYGFYMDVTRKHSGETFSHYLSAYQELPIAGLSTNGIFACHGGVPDMVSSLKEIQDAKRRTVDFEDPIIQQIVWNDPEDRDFDFRNNIRGRDFRTYGKKAFDRFCENLGINLMFRAHQVFEEGYETFFDDRLVSVFSTEYQNRVKPKVARVGKNLKYELLRIH